jgi:3-hydroxyisobutyrate dehydrogenase-like beta-hydroxyacid dehydrogenase
MDVTIIGAGNMGRGIGTRLVAGGNRVRILDRDAAQARELAEELQASAAEGALRRAVGQAMSSAVTSWCSRCGTRMARNPRSINTAIV